MEPAASYSSPSLLTGWKRETVEIVGCWIRAALRMGRRWRGTAAEEESQFADGIGDVDLTVVVTVASVHAGTESATEQKGEHVDRISDVAATVAIGIATDEEHFAERQLETDFCSAALELFALIILGDQSER